MTPDAQTASSLSTTENEEKSVQYQREMDENYVAAVSMKLVETQGFSLELLTHYQAIHDRVPSNELEELESRFSTEVFEAYERHRDRVLTADILHTIKVEGDIILQETLDAWSDFERVGADDYIPVPGFSRRPSL